MEKIVKVINFEMENDKNIKGRIVEFEDGTFEAFTTAQVKSYKTLRGAKNFMVKNGYIETEEIKKEEENETIKPVEKLTYSEMVERAADIINKDAFVLDNNEVVALYVQGVKLYGYEFERNVLHTVYSLVNNTIKKFVIGKSIELEETLNIILTSQLNTKTLKNLKAMCKTYIREEYDFDNMQKWELIILLHCYAKEEDLTIGDILNPTIPADKIQRLITAINEVNPLLDELNEAMEDIMDDRRCGKLGVTELIKDFYTSVTCSGFLEDFVNVARCDLKDIKKQ